MNVVAPAISRFLGRLDPLKSVEETIQKRARTPKRNSQKELRPGIIDPGDPGDPGDLHREMEDPERLWN